MKGLLFNVVEEVVVEAFGRDTWDEAVDRSGVSGAYTSLGSYPDAELGALVAALCDLAGVAPDDALVMVGRAGFPTSCCTYSSGGATCSTTSPTPVACSSR